METLDPVAASRRPGAPALTAKNSLADATLAGAHPRWAVTMGAVVGRVVVVDLVPLQLKVEGCDVEVDEQTRGVDDSGLR